MVLSGHLGRSDQAGCGLAGPSHGEGNDAEKQVQFLRACEPRVLEIQAACFRITEEAFDGPSFPLGGKRVICWRVRCYDEQFFTLDAPRGEIQFERRVRFRPCQAGGKLPRAPTLAQQRLQGQFAPILSDNVEAFPHPDNHGDVIFIEKTQPADANELSIRQKQLDAGGTEQGQIAPHQGNPIIRVAGASLVQNRPHQRHPMTPRDDGQHEDVHVLATDLPIGPVQTQMPRRGQAQQFDYKSGGPVSPKINMLKEPLKPTIGRCDFGGCLPFAGQVAEVHRPGAHHRDDQKTKRLHPALAQKDMGAQCSAETGEGLLDQGTLLLAKKSPPEDHLSPPSATTVVQYAR